MSGDTLIVQQQGPVRWLILNRSSRRNALNDEITRALETQISDVADDPGTRVAVLAGEGPSFCAGGDFRHFLEADRTDGVVSFLSRLSSCVDAIARSEKPWVAALHGHAIAGGLELALACDIVVAARGTLIGDGHLNNRLLPAAGSAVRLERAVGKGIARWMHLSGEPLLAEQLVATGWLHEITPIDELRDRAHAVALKLAHQDPGAQQRFKRLLNAIESDGDTSALALELRAFGENWVASDVPAALTEFLAARDQAKVTG